MAGPRVPLDASEHLGSFQTPYLKTLRHLLSQETVQYARWQNGCNMHAGKIDVPIVPSLDVVKTDEVNKNREE